MTNAQRLFLLVTTLLGQVVKVSTSRVVDVGSILAFTVDLFPGHVIPVT